MPAYRFLGAGAALCAAALNLQSRGRRSILSRGDGAALMNRSASAVQTHDTVSEVVAGTTFLCS